MLITKHIVSMKLVGLTPVLRPLFPYEFEIPAGPSMYPGSGGHSRTGSPPVVQFVEFLGRIRFTPQDKYSLLMHRIKIKSPAIFFYGINKTFCVLIYQCSISLTLVVLQRQKSLSDIGGTTYHSRCRLPIAAMGLARRPHHER